jgi:phospholipid-binding lipoprotein MlaA
VTLRALLLAAVATLSACASEFSMRSVPPETPAAVNASAVRAAEAMEAAAKEAAAGKKPTSPNQQPADTLTNNDGAAREHKAGAPVSGAAQAQPTPDEEGAAQKRRAGAPSRSADAGAPTPGDAPAPSPTPGAAPLAEGAMPAQPTQTGPGTTTTAAGASAGSNPDTEEPLVPLTEEDVPSMYTYDPWEGVNRFTYRFNARFDEAIFLPVTNGYRRVPGPIRLGVHNFFSNLTEIDSFANYILQARFGGSAKSLGRFVINSTIGIGGLFDVAKHMKLPSAPTGFSETMSTWGAHPGPYLVMPILGPSTLRDGVGYLGDYALDYGVNPFNIYRGYASYGLGTLNAIDTRSNVGFRYYATGSPFEYEVIRFLYVRKRLIEDDALHGRGKPKPRDAGAPAGR